LPAVRARARHGPVDAQDRTDEKLAVRETQVAKRSKAISSLKKRVKAQKGVATTGVPNGTATPGGAAGGSEGTLANPIPVGQSAETGAGWRVTVVDVVPNATDQVRTENRFNEPPAEGRRSLLVTVSVTYQSEGSTGTMGSAPVRRVTPLVEGGTGTQTGCLRSPTCTAAPPYRERPRWIPAIGRR
jgi:hypothetical protein